MPRPIPEINAGSMADIAFLLLIFFLVTTTIDSDKGIAVALPPKQELKEQVPVKERNIFKILVNSKNQILASDKVNGTSIPVEVSQIKDMVLEFVDNTNRKNLPTSSEAPEKAVVSIQTDRGTNYELYISIQDAIKTAYNELRASSIQMSLQDYQLLIDKTAKTDDEDDKLKKAREKYPYIVSDADPTAVGG